MTDRSRVAILISGRGSNMMALVEHGLTTGAYEVVLVASNVVDAAGLEWARLKGLPTWAHPSKGMARADFDALLSAQLEEHDVGTIALAGYMRLLSPEFIARWRGKILNIHPSLLPKYKGLDTHGRAIAAGDTVAGCSVHVVTEELDAGEVLGQVEVPVLPDDTADSLSARILREEHKLYPRVLEEFVTRS